MQGGKAGVHGVGKDDTAIFQLHDVMDVQITGRVRNTGHIVFVCITNALVLFQDVFKANNLIGSREDQCLRLSPQTHGAICAHRMKVNAAIGFHAHQKKLTRLVRGKRQRYLMGAEPCSQPT